MTTLRDDSEFDVEFRAGQTVLTPESGSDIYRPQGLSAWVINLTTEGLGRIDGPGSGMVVQPGDLLLWQPQAVHDYGREATLRRWTHLWVTFHPRESWYDLLQWPTIMPGICHLPRPAEPMIARLERLFHEIIDVAWSPLPAQDRLSMALLETLLLWCNTLNPRVDSRVRDPRIEAVLGLLTENFTAPMTLDFLARQVGLSQSRLSHLFKRQVGTAPMQYLEGLRLRRACDLLVMTDMPVAAIAEEVGYTNAAYFTSLFRRRYGHAPTAYREHATRHADSAAQSLRGAGRTRSC